MDISLVAVLAIGLMIGLVALTASRLRGLAQDRDRANAFARTLVDGASIGVAACDAEGRLTFINAELLRMHGRAEADIDLGGWTGQYAAAALRGNVPSTDMPLHRALRGEVLRGIEMTIAQEDAAPRHVRVNADPLLDSNGATIGAVASVQDESDRRDADENRRRLAAIVEWSNDPIISKSLDGEIRSWNEAAERLYGYSAAEAIGSNISMIVPVDRQDELAELMRRVSGAERVERLETVRRRKDGRLIRVNLTLSPIFDADSKIVGASVIGHDVSDRQRDDRMFGQLMEMAPDAVIGVGRDGRIEVVNSQTQAMFGYEREQLIGEPIEVLVPGRFQGEHPGQRDDYLREPTLRPMGPGQALFARRRDGSEFACEITIAPVETDRGQVAMALVRDVTDRKEVELEADRLKSEFFGLVSHELRTPLTSIVGYADVLSEEEGERFSEEGRRYLAIVKRNSERLDRLVQDLLLVGQVGAGTFNIRVGVVDIEAATRECVEHFRPAAVEAGVELSVESHEVRLFGGDQNRLNQVLDNLISNALKFTPPRGQVVVRVHERDETCVVDIEDTGLGLDPEEIEHLFDRFYRGTQANASQIKGVGLGLAITKAIVEAHGGEIEVESEPGLGSNFRVHLPLKEIETTDADASNQAARSVSR
jgi:PAS domain S-box-containing protein